LTGGSDEKFDLDANASL
ncbi:hypothetical protein Tco_0043989, partial [Tanacetum coccineum]